MQSFYKTARWLIAFALLGIATSSGISCQHRVLVDSSAVYPNLSPGKGEDATLRITPDQANEAAWTNAWTNLVNDVRQTFTPSLSTLTAVEVELVLANPGPSAEAVTLTVLDTDGEPLATVSQSVQAADCNHVLFILPQSGLKVLPGRIYALRLSGGTTFGWKYVVGGYEKGAASFNGQPLLPDARSTFLFRSFGAP